LYAQIARSAADTTIPFLAQLFSERFARLSQRNGENDPTQTLEELYWLLLITSHVLTDSGEGETLLVNIPSISLLLVLLKSYHDF
jgi:hypothetical protein